MKVFHFDPVTGLRGKYIRTDRVAVTTSNKTGFECQLPEIRMPAPEESGTIWNVATLAQYRDGAFIDYGFPVCFCLGEYKAASGAYRAWQWMALVPADWKAPS